MASLLVGARGVRALDGSDVSVAVLEAVGQAVLVVRVRELLTDADAATQAHGPGTARQMRGAGPRGEQPMRVAQDATLTGVVPANRPANVDTQAGGADVQVLAGPVPGVLLRCGWRLRGNGRRPGVHLRLAPVVGQGDAVVARGGRPAVPLLRRPRLALVVSQQHVVFTGVG